MPGPEFAAMTLRAAALVPPTVFPVPPRTMPCPVPASKGKLPRGLVPVTSVPMKFP